MAQNINLIDDLVLQETSTLNSKVAIKTLALWLFLLMIAYLVSWGLQSNREGSLNKLEKEKKELDTKITGYNQQLAPLKKSSDSRNLPTSSINTAGFYRYLEDFSELTPHGVWFKTITLSEQDETITLEGSAIIASSVSALINSLSESKDFKNKKFDTLQLQENLDTGNTDFTISTISADQLEKARNERNRK